MVPDGFAERVHALLLLGKLDIRLNHRVIFEVVVHEIEVACQFRELAFRLSYCSVNHLKVSFTRSYWYMLMAKLSPCAWVNPSEFIPSRSPLA